jgi:hypothetical protein
MVGSVERMPMDRPADRLQSRPAKGAFIPGGKSLAALAGAIATVVAAVIATVLAVALAASVLVVAVMGAALLLLASIAVRARRTVKARSPRGPQIIEARNVGGHSWVAYGWDRRR